MYRWEFNTPDDEYPALLLPAVAQKSLRDLLNALVFDPHGYQRTKDEPVGKSMRYLHFADGRGMVIVNIMDRDELIVIVQVDWFG